MPNKSPHEYARLAAWRKRVQTGDEPMVVPNPDGHPWSTMLRHPQYNCGWCDVAFHDENTLASHEGIVHPDEVALGRPRKNEKNY